jgi:Arginine methyltransferase oligomerization subdomain
MRGDAFESASMNKAPLSPLIREEAVNYYYYLGLIRAKQRVAAFQQAIRAVVRPTDIVVEIGSGLGTYSFFAASSGARHVYAIERERVIHIAEELAARNGMAEKITFVHSDSIEAALKEKGDVLILEDFSSLFVRRGLEELVRDAANRHLKGDGIIIPRAVSLWLVPVGDLALWKGLLNLEDDNYHLYGFDFRLLRQMMLDSPHVRKVDPRALLAEPRAFKTIELKQPQTYVFDQLCAFEVVRSGTMFGLAGWFDLELTSDISLSNAPTNDESVWRQVFFPFSNPLDVTEGETVTARLSSVRSARTQDIWWTWQAKAASGSSSNSSFQGIPLQTSRLDTAEALS